jgi:hypothetical protein
MLQGVADVLLWDLTSTSACAYLDIDERARFLIYGSTGGVLQIWQSQVDQLSPHMCHYNKKATLVLARILWPAARHFECVNWPTVEDYG